ncbi:hypothetical protein FQR65_LT16630 [Abscondita terminalis]|nr:hypothetical protein FQR65_LT16630 [Abscondita terminalis]
MTKRHKSIIQAAEMKFLRRVRGVTKKDKLRNSQIREDLGISSILEHIEEKQLSWWGHLQRMKETRPVRKVWEAKLTNKRKRGRPRKTWEKVIGEILEKRGTTWVEAKSRARNKKEWCTNGVLIIYKTMSSVRLIREEVPYPSPITSGSSSPIYQVIPSEASTSASHMITSPILHVEQIPSRPMTPTSSASSTGEIEDMVIRKIKYLFFSVYIKQLSEMREMISSIWTLMQRLESKVDSLQATTHIANPINEEEEVFYTDLPLKSEEEFESFDNKLKTNPRFAQRLGKRLFAVGGRSCRHLLQNMLKTVMTDTVAETFSLSGKSGRDKTKKAFLTTEIFKILSYASKRCIMNLTLS